MDKIARDVRIAVILLVAQSAILLIVLLSTSLFPRERSVAEEVNVSAEQDLEATEEAKTAELPEVDLYDLDVTSYGAETSVGTLVDYHESTVYNFSAEVGPSMYVYTDEAGQIKAIQTRRLIGWPTTLYYVDRDTYQTAAKYEKRFLQISGEPFAKVVVGKNELLLDSEQLSLMTDLFAGSRPYLALTEIGQLGYIQGSKVELSKYLERCDYTKDDAGIYWSTEEESKPEHEGFKLNVVEHDGKNYILPEFYAKSDKTEKVKSWQPSDEKIWAGEDPYNSVYAADVDDDELYVSEFVLEGIMQCVQRGGRRWLYQYLDPGISPKTYRNTLFYEELHND